MTVRDELLVDVTALAEALSSPHSPTVLDVRWRLQGPPAVADYAAGHVPGAAFLDLDADLCGTPGRGGRHPLPEPRRLEAALRRAGVSARNPVVVYDGGDGAAAARTWWTLRWAGHPRVRVLDGGYAAWLAAGAPVTSTPTGHRAGDFSVTPGAMPVLDAAQAARIAGTYRGGVGGRGADAVTSGTETNSAVAGADGVGALIDVRAAARYRGEREPIDAIAGHIPGAVNLPTTEHLDDRGRFRDGAELAQAFAGVGVVPGRPVGAYCGSGVTAAHTILALHLAGRPDAGLYVGSWSHWITDPTRPVATSASAPTGGAG